MIISSELTGKTYETVDECLAAEALHKEEEQKKKEAEKLRKEELDKAYEEAIAACDKYLKLVGVKDRIFTIEKPCNFTLMAEPTALLREFLGI